MSLDNTQQPIATTQPTVNQGQVNSGIAPSQPTAPNLLSSNPNQVGGLGDWKASLDSDMQVVANSKGWKHPNEAIKSYAELEKTMGSRGTKQIFVPKEGAPESEWNAYYEKLGRPQKSDDYKFERSKDFTFYDETATAEFKQMAHKAGLTDKQAKMIHDQFYAYENKRYAEQNAKLENRTNEIETNMKKEWGAAYTDKIEKAKVVANKYFGKNPEVIDALHQVLGEEFYKMLDDLSKVSIDPKIITGGSSHNYNLTPEEALREIKRLQGDAEFGKKWLDKNHPEHEYSKSEMTRLNRLAYPS